MDRTTQVLRDLKALGAELDKSGVLQVKLHEDGYGVLHLSHLCAKSAPSTPPVRVSHRELLDRMLCPACTEAGLWEESPVLVEGAELLEHHRLALGTGTYTDPLEGRRALRRMQSAFNAVRQAGKMPEALHPVVENVREELTASYDRVKAELRSPRVRDLLLATCRKETGSLDGGSQLALSTIHRYAPRFVADELYDTVVLSHWEKMVGLGNFLVVAPIDVHHWMRNKEVPKHWGELSEPVPVQEAEDVEQLVETVAALWAPKERSVFADLQEAVQAARML